MLSFTNRLSARQKFWFGFACCPFIGWVSLVLSLIVFLSTEQGSNSQSPEGALLIGALLFFSVASAFSGFCTAFFWHHLAPNEGPESSAGFWGIVLAWSPIVWFVGVSFFVLFPLFVLLYYWGLWRGYAFWDSNRPNQWVGDFSDMS